MLARDNHDGYKWEHDQDGWSSMLGYYVTLGADRRRDRRGRRSGTSSEPLVSAP